MNEQRIHNLIKILIGVLIVGLLAGMLFMVMRYRSDMQKRSRRISALTAEARGYEAELNELRREQENEEKNLYRPENPGAAVIAFLIDGETTLVRARALGKTYGFTPAILLRGDDDKVDAVLGAINGTGLDVILYSRGIDTAANLRALERRVSTAGCVNTYACLLRAADDTEENRELLAKAKISTLFLYENSLATAITENGTTELNYSYINKSSYSPANRLADLSYSEQGLLFAFDLVETTATDRQIEEILGMIRGEADAGRITIGSVEDAVRRVKSRTEREAEKTAAFLAVQQTRNARIEELEGIIREIYSHWDD